jgi:hypothetical protein
MPENIPVHAARIPDRDRLLGELREAGLDARPIGEVDIEVPYGDGSPEAVHDVYSQVEGMIISLGAPFVPIQHEGVIYVRPPIS